MVPPTDSKPLTEDLPCLRCQYNLRGLAAEMACPECGAPVAYSVAGYLPLADFRWLRLVRLGVLAELASMFAAFLATGWGWTTRVGPPGTLLFLSKMLFALGVFLITTPEARQAWLLPRTSLRITVRMLAVLSLTGYLLPIAPNIYSLDVLSWGFEFAGALAAFGAYCILRWAAARMPDRLLMRRTTMVMTGLLAVHIAGILFAVAGVSIRHTVLSLNLGFLGSPGSRQLQALVWAYCIAAFVLNIMNVLLLVRYEARLRGAARTASHRIRNPNES